MQRRDGHRLWAEISLSLSLSRCDFTRPSTHLFPCSILHICVYCVAWFDSALLHLLLFKDSWKHINWSRTVYSMRPTLSDGWRFLLVVVLQVSLQQRPDRAGARCFRLFGRDHSTVRKASFFFSSSFFLSLLSFSSPVGKVNCQKCLVWLSFFFRRACGLFAERTSWNWARGVLIELLFFLPLVFFSMHIAILCI